MLSPRVRRLLVLVGVPLGLTFVLLGAIEVASRIWERGIRRDNPRDLEARELETRTLPRKGASELRVFLFGGSSVYGVPVPQVAFVAQTRYWLTRLYPNRDIRLYNFAYPSRPTAWVRDQFIRRLQDQPDLMIVISGHNEFLQDPQDTRSADLRQILERHSATMRMVEFATRKFRMQREENVMPAQIQPWDRQSAAYRSRVAAFEGYLNEMISLASARGIKLVIGTLPSNLADWPPVYKRLAGRDAHYPELISRIQDLLRGGSYPAASDALAEGFQRYPEDATLYFLRGKLQAAKGNDADALASFTLARDLDPLPYRTTSELNSIIRKKATARGVVLLDLERSYGQRSKDGLVGLELIGDNVHGTPLGESITTQAILDLMAREGFLGPSLTISPECCPLNEFLTDAGYFKPDALLHLNVLLEYARYVMKTPHLNYDLSRKYLSDALQVDQNSWEVWANLATISYLSGDPSQGAREFERAKSLRHAPLDGSDRGRTPYLKEALEIAARWAAGGSSSH